MEVHIDKFPSVVEPAWFTCLYQSDGDDAADREGQAAAITELGHRPDVALSLAPNGTEQIGNLISGVWALRLFLAIFIQFNSYFIDFQSILSCDP